MYNKDVLKKPDVLVDNWEEERALYEFTGNSRRAFDTTKRNPEYMNTGKRLIEHEEKVSLWDGAAVFVGSDKMTHNIILQKSFITSSQAMNAEVTAERNHNDLLPSRKSTDDRNALERARQAYEGAQIAKEIEAKQTIPFRKPDRALSIPHSGRHHILDPAVTYVADLRPMGSTSGPGTLPGANLSRSFSKTLDEELDRATYN